MVSCVRAGISRIFRFLKVVFVCSICRVEAFLLGRRSSRPELHPNGAPGTHFARWNESDTGPRRGSVDGGVLV